MDITLLKLLQLASPTLPVGGYSYSEGLETLVEKEIINSKKSLENWLKTELNNGAIALETAIMLRAYRSFIKNQINNITYWNNWLSATKETSELRQQSWQMGNTLLRLLVELEKSNKSIEEKNNILPLEKCASILGKPCNYAIAFGIGAANWQIEEQNALLGYLNSWTTNLINAGVKLIPLGQTDGQKILFNLQNIITLVSKQILSLEDDDLSSCSWGLGLASMAHEQQYTRLFRS